VPKMMIAVPMMFLLMGCGSTGSPGLEAISVNPKSGTGSQQLFTVVYSHTGGAAQITSARILFNREIDGRNACYVYYDRPSASFLLVNDSGEGTNRLPLGSALHIENSQCDLDGSASGTSDNGNEVSIRLSLKFKKSFAGEKNTYLYAVDASGKSTGFQGRGTWKIPD
jgi:hypothetical protein